MKKTILKDVAMPPKVFGAPVNLAMVNAGVFIVLHLISPVEINPIFFILIMLCLHLLLVFFGKKEPHLSKLLQNKGKKAEILCDKYDVDGATVLFKDGCFSCVFDTHNNRISDTDKKSLLDEMRNMGISIRFFRTKGNTYLILSGKSFSKKVIQVISARFPSYELLTNSTQITAGDVFRTILNPIEDNLFSTNSSLSEKALLTNIRSSVQKDIMCFEQDGKKLYTTVLCLQKIENEVDFDFINQLDSESSVLSWIEPLSTPKSAAILHRMYGMAKLTRVQGDFEEVMKMALRGEVFFFYGLNIYVSASSVQQLEVKKEELIQKAKLYGMSLVSEKWNLPLAFYMGFPQYEMPRYFLLPGSLFA